MFDRPDRFDSTVTWRFLKIDFMIPLLKRQCSLPNASQSAITASHAIPLQNSRDESTPRPRLIIVPLNAHNRRLRTPRMRAQTRCIGNISLIPHNIRRLQLPKKVRIVTPIRTLAVVLVSGRPIVVCLSPLLRDVGLDVRMLAHAIHGFGFALGSGVCRLHFGEAPEAVVVLIAEIEDAVLVAAALGDFVGSAACLLEELTTALIEVDDSGAGILTGSRKAALDSALPVWLVVADGEPVLDVVTDTHLESLVDRYRGRLRLEVLQSCQRADD
jgi:hypothetical protein